MKPYLFVTIVLFSSLFVSCDSDQNQTCMVDISVPHEKFDSVTYMISKENITAYGSRRIETEYFDSTGNLQLSFETDGINWLFFTIAPSNNAGISISKLNRVFLLVQPDKHYSIIYDSTYPMRFRIMGDFEEASNLFNSLSQSQRATGNDWTTNDANSMSTFLVHLQDSISNSIKPFDDLLRKKKIDKDYYNAVYNQIKYSHSNGLLHSIAIRRSAYLNPNFVDNNPEISPLQLSERKLYELEEMIFKRYPISKDDAGLLPSLGDYIDNYIKYKTRPDKFNYLSYKGKLAMVNLSSGFLEDDLLEMYFAYQFSSMSAKNSPDSLVTFLFKEFKERYPDSPFMPGVMRSIEGLTGHYSAFYPGLYNTKRNLENTIKSNQVMLLSPQLKIINDTITSLDSLLVQFRGTNLFIDFWASWCPPCRYEFRFADTLHHFLESHNIKMLYISTDEDEDKWKNALSQYDLKGYHYRASNPELRKEIKKIIDFIPTYMIIDTTGIILNYNAEKPHTKSLLYKQLEEELNLLK